ncbi:MAG: hypothetical protein VX904_05040 [Planctomycetota bacterium]|nr:hypothetical protein [Planctomycetota bacterium]
MNRDSIPKFPIVVPRTSIVGERTFSFKSAVEIAFPTGTDCRFLPMTCVTTAYWLWPRDAATP